MNYKGLEMPELIACEPQIHKDNRGFVFEGSVQYSVSALDNS